MVITATLTTLPTLRAADNFSWSSSDRVAHTFHSSTCRGVQASTSNPHGDSEPMPQVRQAARLDPDNDS